MLNSLFKAVANVAEIVVAPVAVAAVLVEAATRPLANVAKDIVETVKDELE